MSKTEATATRFLPLRLSRSGMIITADGYGIAQTSGELISVNPIADAYWEDVPNGAEEVRALFALIVRAVNNHDALVGALEDVQRLAGGFRHDDSCPVPNREREPGTCDRCDIMAIVNPALAAAEKAGE